MLRKALVRQWQASTILPHGAAQDEVSRGALSFRKIEAPSFVVVHAIAYLSGASSPIDEVASLLREVMTSLVASGSWPDAQII
jgi:hypothetical protein